MVVGSSVLVFGTREVTVCSVVVVDCVVNSEVVVTLVVDVAISVTVVGVFA